MKVAELHDLATIPNRNKTIIEKSGWYYALTYIYQ